MLEDQGKDHNASATEPYGSQIPASTRCHSTPLSRAEMSLELQLKLLRVLQDHEFERLGSVRTIHISVRVLAALPNKRGRNCARSKEALSEICDASIGISLVRCAKL